MDYLGGPDTMTGLLIVQESGGTESLHGTLRLDCSEDGAYAKKGRFPLQGKKRQESGLSP